MPWQVFDKQRPSNYLPVLPTTWASPANIASLVRAPLRFAKGAVRFCSRERVSAS